MSPFRAAAVQMHSGEDKQENLRAAEAAVERAARQGAEVVSLPELFSCLGRARAMADAAEDIPGETSDRLAALARRLGITLLAGSIAERRDEDERFYNTSLLFGPDGELLAQYRKLHLFDVALPGQVTVKESDAMCAGDDVATADTAIGRVGLSICYDLRFPELYRRFADEGVRVVFVPSAFSLPTGRDHWSVLLRARAIENQVYVIAANQHGRHTEQLVTYGRSTIIDPWGIELATAADAEQVISAEIDLARLESIRTRLPALAHRRL